MPYILKHGNYEDTDLLESETNIIMIIWKGGGLKYVLVNTQAHVINNIQGGACSFNLLYIYIP